MNKSPPAQNMGAALLLEILSGIGTANRPAPMTGSTTIIYPL